MGDPEYTFERERVGGGFRTLLGVPLGGGRRYPGKLPQEVETNRKLSTQLRGAEDRMKELEAKLRYHEDRVDRAERWLHHVSVEIEEKFLGRDKAASR